MAIPKFLDDLNIISKLGNYPGSDNGLSTQAFKAKFDEGALKLQSYINDTLLPHLNQLVDVQALLNGILDMSLSKTDKAANAWATGDALNKKLDKLGGTMSGILNMGSKKITNLATPENDYDAANKKFAEDLVASKHFFRTVALPVSGWSGSGPYAQTVTVKDILEDDEPHWGLVRSGDAAAKLAQKEAFALVDELDTADGTVTFTCDEEKPEVALTILLEVNR